MILSRRSFIKGLIRCTPAIVVPKLVFDLAPGKTIDYIPNPDFLWKWVNPPDKDPNKRVGYFASSEVIGVDLSDIYAELCKR